MIDQKVEPTEWIILLCMLHRESTMGDRVGSAHGLVRPLLNALRQYVFAAGKIHTDDTPIAVLSPRNGTTRQTTLWTYVRDDRPHGGQGAPAAWYCCSPDREGMHPQTQLKASCKPTHLLGTTRFMKRAMCWRLGARLMPGATSTTSTKSGHRPSRRTRLKPTPSSITSRQRSEKNRPMSGERCDRRAPRPT